MKKKKNWHSYVKSHNLYNRVIDMLDYYDFFKKTSDVDYAKKKIKDKMQSFYFIESLSQFFEKKMKKVKNNPTLRCNLYDLINDLDYLKQYLVIK